MPEPAYQKPADCIMIVGIPLTMEEYDCFKTGNLDSDFLQCCCPGRLKFYNEICAPLSESLPQILKYGCPIVYNPSPSAIVEAFEKDVVVLFTHWNNNHIELGGKMVPDELFCSWIPPGFQGLIDLCACQPDAHLVVSIKLSAPQSTVKCTTALITPSVWVEILSWTLMLLAKHELTYREAVHLSLKEILRRKSNNKSQ